LAEVARAVQLALKKSNRPGIARIDRKVGVSCVEASRLPLRNSIERGGQRRRCATLLVQQTRALELMNQESFGRGGHCDCEFSGKTCLATIARDYSS
jgi:hypothetical protein